MTKTKTERVDSDRLIVPLASTKPAAWTAEYFKGLPAGNVGEWTERTVQVYRALQLALHAMDGLDLPYHIRDGVEEEQLTLAISTAYKICGAIVLRMIALDNLDGE